MAGLLAGDVRLLDDVRDSRNLLDFLDDRGLEDAEALIHELRHLYDRTGRAEPRMERALAALSEVRTLTKRSA